MILIVRDSEIKSNIGLGYIRVFVDGDKENLSPENIILLTKKEFKYLCRIAPIETLKNEILLSAIELARLRILTNSTKEVYTATNLKTGEVIKENNKTKISMRLTSRKGQYNDCKKIGENGERYIRDWKVERRIEV